MASRPHLTFACGPYDRMDALARGEVRPAGIDLNYITIEHPRDIFDRMIGGMEFDVSEMSSSEYICRYADGERDLVAIPVFTSRAFRHSCIAINSDLVRKPSDLNGKRIGVQLYTMTAAVWIRGLLRDAGVDLSSITWVEGDLNKPGPHGKPITKPLCRPVKRVPNEDPARGLSKLLEDGELAATIGAESPDCLGKAPNIQLLFPKPHDAERQYYHETGIFPIMHLVVIRKDVVDKYPFVPSSLYDAMCQSKDEALRRLKFRGTYRYMLPFLPSYLEETNELFRDDPWPYGVEGNRKTLEALASFLYDQGMIPTKVAVDDVFVPIRGRNIEEKAQIFFVDDKEPWVARDYNDAPQDDRNRVLDLTSFCMKK